MADLSGYSDEELEAIANPKKDLSGYSDEELHKIANQEEPNIAQKALGKAVDIYERYSAAPGRKALSTLLNTGSPVSAISSGLEQIGAPAQNAPTGKEIASKQLGLSAQPFTKYSPEEKEAGLTYEDLVARFMQTPEGPEKEALRTEMEAPTEALPSLGKQISSNVSPAGVGGVGVDIVSDPLTYLPVGEALKVASKPSELASSLLRGGANVAGKAVDLGKGALEKGGEILAKVGEKSESPFLKTLAQVPEDISAEKELLKQEISKPLRPEFEKQANLIIEEGGDPTLLSASHKYGPDSFKATAESVERQAPLGQSYKDKFQAGVKQTNEIFDKKISEIGGGEVPVDTDVAGEKIVSAYDKRVDDFFNQRDLSYKGVSDLVNGQGVKLELTENAKETLNRGLNSVKRDAEKLLRAPTPNARTQGKLVLEEIDYLEKSLKNQNKGKAGQFKKVLYDDVVDKLQTIGEYAYKTKPIGASDIAPNRKLYGDLYKTLQEATLKTVDESLGKDVGQSLRENNKAFTEFFNKQAPLKDVLESEKNGAKIYSNIVASGDTKKLQELKEFLGKDSQGWKQVKATFLDQQKALLADGAYNYGDILKKFNQDDKTSRIAKVLFEPGELDKIKEIAKIGHDYGPGKMNASRSGEFLSHESLSLPTSIGEAGKAVGGLVKNARKSLNRRALINATESEGSTLDEILRQMTEAKQAEKAAPQVPGMLTQQPQSPLSILDVLEKQKQMASAQEAKTAADKFNFSFVPSQTEVVVKGGIKMLQIMDPNEVEQARKELSQNEAMGSIEKAKAMSSLNQFKALPVSQPAIEPFHFVPLGHKKPSNPATNAFDKLIRSRRPQDF